MTRQKTTQPKFFDKLKVSAAAFALALPLCAGCVKKDTTPPASQPSGYTEMKRTTSLRMGIPMEMNKKPATTQPASAPVTAHRDASTRTDRAPVVILIDTNPSSIKTATSSQWVTAGTKLAAKNCMITVLEVDEHGIRILIDVQSPRRRILLPMSYGEEHNGAYEFGIFRAEKVGVPNYAELKIR